MKSMLKNRYILPILLLYLLTSVGFLSAFSFGYYKERSVDEIRDLHQNLVIISHKVKFGLADGIHLDEIREILGDLKLNLYAGGKALIHDFEPPIFRGKFAVSGDFVFFRDYSRLKNTTKHSPKEQQSAKKGEFEKFRTSTNKNDIYLELMASLPNSNLLLTQIILADLAILLVILTIAYFLLRLSYRPFVAQINRLNDFIADTTHEINTPLCVILMSVEMFEKNPEKYLQNIKIASKNLNSIFNNLSSNLREEPHEVSLVNVKELLINKTELLKLNANNITFALNADEVVLYTDKFRLDKIIENLLTNAIKYGFNSSMVSIVLHRESLSVTNQGEEISPQNLKKMYEKFSRFNSKSGVGGFGIGLNLVKRYCNELGFKVSCLSFNKQTTFKVEFK